MTAIRLFLRRLRQDRLPAVLLLLVVFATAFAAASAPRLFDTAADDGLRHEIRTATAVERNLQLGRITRLEGARSGMEPVREVQAEIREALPETVRSVLDGESAFAESIGWTVRDRPSTRPGFMTLRFQEGLDGHIQLTDGRLPGGEVAVIEAPEPPPSSVPPSDPGRALLFEVMLSTRTAQELGVGVSDRMFMVPDTDDPLVGAFAPPEQVAVEVTGLYEVSDPDADFWVGEYALHQPTLIPIGINVVEIHSTALLSPEAYPALMGLDYPARYTFRHYVDPDGLHAGLVDELGTELRRMESAYASFATTPDPTRTTLQTALLDLVERFRAERRSAEAVLVTAAIGPAAVALAAIGVLTLLAVQRRRRTFVTLRGRGGSAAQLAGSHLVEGLVVAVPAAVLAAWLSTVVVAGRPTPWSFTAAGAVALATVAVFAGGALPAGLLPLRRLLREQPATVGASPRRLAFEALAVVLAVGGVVLLRQRGLAGGSAAGQLAGVDPFLAAVPALVGLAVGIVTVRLYPLPVRAAGWLAAGGRGLVPALGLRRAERQTGTGNLPLLVLLLTTAIGTFSSTMLATIDRGQSQASWQAVGAAHRVDLHGSAPGLDLESVEGVEAVAAVHRTAASVGIAGGSRVNVLALDSVAYTQVTAGTPVETRFPRSFAAEPGEARPGTTDAPIPAIVSARLADTSTTNLGRGETFELTISGRFATFVVADVRDQLPGLGGDQEFIVVPRPLLEAGLIDRSLPPTTLFVRAPAESADALRAAIADAGVAGTVRSQAARLDELRERPLVGAVAAGFTIALGLAVAYAALALTVALVLAGTARARETAQLRTMGVAPRQVAALAVLEHAPPVLVAIAAGLLLGVAVAWVVLPGLGLATFVGSRADPALTVDIGQLLVLGAALAVVVAAGIGLSTVAQRMPDPARSVREAVE